MWYDKCGQVKQNQQKSRDEGELKKEAKEG